CSVVLSFFPAEAAGDVKDRAGLFSPAAVLSAEDGIEAIKNLYGKDCVIATAPAIPENRKEIFNKLQEKNRGMFFRGWAMDFMQQELVKDLYILICKEPLHVEIVPSSEVQENILRSKGNAQLHHLLVERLKEKKYDQGLLEAVQFVRSKYDSQVFELY